MSFMWLLDSLKSESAESNNGPGWKYQQSSKRSYQVRICSYHERNGISAIERELDWIGLEWQDFDIELSKKNSSGLLDSIQVGWRHAFISFQDGLFWSVLRIQNVRRMKIDIPILDCDHRLTRGFVMVTFEYYCRWGDPSKTSASDLVLSDCYHWCSVRSSWKYDQTPRRQLADDAVLHHPILAIEARESLS